MNLLRILLFPISLVYGIIVWLRNRFYDLGWLKSTPFDIPVISVGNLEVGGSGKTPLTEYLVNLLSSDYKLAVLSRGYGRKTKGFRWVNKDDKSVYTGDEPLQIKNKFSHISVAVCEDRTVGIRHTQEEKHQLVIMDDAYQHRAVKPGYSILVFDYNRLSKPKLLLPAGNYRDLFSERKRADIILISKTPEDLNNAGKRDVLSKISPFPHQKLVFSGVKYNNRLVHLFDEQHYISPENINNNTAILLITGIAKPELLLKQVKKYSLNVKHHDYPDHHLFSQKNMLKLVKEFEQLNTENKIIITTEKDAVRLTSDENKKYIYNLPVYKWPMEIAFHEEDKDIFDNEIINYVKRNKRVC